MSKRFRFGLIGLLQITILNIFAQDIEQKQVSVSTEKTSLIQFLNKVSTENQVQFYYKKEWFEGDSIALTISDIQLGRLLDKISDSRAIMWLPISEDAIVFLPKDQVATLLGNMVDMSGSKNINTVEVGKMSEAGKYANVILKGTVKDGKNDEPVIGASLRIANTNIGCMTDANGKYQLRLSPGIYEVEVSSVGYEKNVWKVKLISTGEFNPEIFEKSTKIDEITIYAKRADKNVRSNQMSLIDLDSKSIKQLPSMVGGKDIIKSFTMMPGVKSVGEFGSGINVRGGGDDQNLYLIEGAPLLNTSHVLGMMSVLNPDIVSNVALYKGQIPANYGERVSSVMEIQVRENNIKNFHVKGGIGLYDGRVLVEGPISKKVTYKIGGRSSYSNWLLGVIPDANIQKSAASFYDLNSYISWAGEKDRVSLFAYYSNDYFRYARLQAYNYGNILGSVNWNHYYNENLSSTGVLAYSNYSAEKDEIEVESESSSLKTGVQYFSGKYNLRYTGFSSHSIDGGLQVIHYNVSRGEMSPYNDLSIIPSSKLEKEKAFENAVYLNDSWNINEKISLNLGLRYSAYFTVGPKTQLQYLSNSYTEDAIIDTVFIGNNKIGKKYFGLEPRVAAKYQFNNQTSVKMSYNRNYQYITMLSYTAISIPSDVWKLADDYIRPVQSDQYAIGFYRNNKENTIETSVEFYYKNLSNVTEFKNNAVVEMNPYPEQELLNAKGQNYGIELMLKKNKGKWDGWISYTYSRSLRKAISTGSGNINNGKEYPSAFDKPHDLSILANYHINKRWRMSFNFFYSTGRPFTKPEKVANIENGNKIVLYSDRNKYRIPDYHRLDFSISMDESLRKSKKWKGSWTFSVLNVYANHNTYSIFYKKEAPSAKNNYNQFSLYKLYILGIPLPTLTYNFIF